MAAEPTAALAILIVVTALSASLAASTARAASLELSTAVFAILAVVTAVSASCVVPTAPPAIFGAVIEPSATTLTSTKAAVTLLPPAPDSFPYRSTAFTSM